VNIQLDLTFLNSFLQLPPDQMLLSFLINFGWIPISFVFLWGSKEVWLNYRSTKWSSTIKSIFLAIDVPRGNDQSLLAVENIFSYIGGAHMPLNLIEKYWEGKFQLSFSFEVASIEGYTQFIIKTPLQYRNLVESAIYAQYPDAEITEIDDYTQGAPTKFPDDKYDIWGGEFILVKPQSYPIKTYPEFEHQFGKPETTFRDPMASLMDLCSSLHEGEQFWYQIIVYPTDFKWTGDGDKEISRILKEPAKKTSSPVDWVMDFLFGTLSFLSDSIMATSEPTKKEEKKDEGLKMMNLKPKEKKQVEAIQRKMGKQGFSCKMRIVYIAKRETINKPKVINGFVGYIKQFMDLDLNSFKPDGDVTGTSTEYFFTNYRNNERKRKIMKAYMSRSGTVGRDRKIYNTEELATLWHFPIEAVVKAPLIQRTSGRKFQPPMSLPVEEISAEEKNIESGIFENIFTQNNQPLSKNKNVDETIIKNEKNNNDKIFNFDEQNGVEKGHTPSNLPFV
jgi:hypothetical protein